MKKLFLPSLVIITIALFFRLYRFEYRYRFEWDQADDANKVTQILTGHLRLIGPQVANENSFFVGPQHYYFLTPFYLLGRGNPYSAAAANILIGTLTAVLPFLLLSHNFLPPTAAFLTSILLAINPDLTSWNAMYAPIFSLIVFFFCLKVLKSSISLRQLYFLFFLLGFATTTHLANAILIFPTLIVILVKRPKFNLFLSAFLFLIPFTPLIIFDLRHQFLNIRQIANLFTSQTNIDYPSSWQIFRRGLSMYYLPISPNTQGLLNLLIVLWSSFILRHRISFWFMLLWFFGPMLFLLLYHRQISEYYFVPALILIPLSIATLLSRLLPAICFFLLLFLFYFQFQEFRQSHSIVLKNKMDIITCLASETKNGPFFLSYDLPVGLNFGFDYILQYYRLDNLIRSEAQAFSISQTSPAIGDKLICQSGPLLLIKK